MRTTIRLDDELLAAAKRQAAERETTLTRLIEDALRAELARRPVESAERVELTTFGAGGLRGGVSLDESAALRDLMDGLR
jgi:predicted transcriptional regulator